MVRVIETDDVVDGRTVRSVLINCGFSDPFVFVASAGPRRSFEFSVYEVIVRMRVDVKSGLAVECRSIVVASKRRRNGELVYERQHVLLKEVVLAGFLVALLRRAEVRNDYLVAVGREFADLCGLDFDDAYPLDHYENAKIHGLLEKAVAECAVPAHQFYDRLCDALRKREKL